MDPDDDPLVCFCWRIPRSTLVAAIRDGATTIEALQEHTRASTRCGSCRFDLLDLLRDAGHATED